MQQRLQSWLIRSGCLFWLTIVMLGAIGAAQFMGKDAQPVTAHVSGGMTPARIFLWTMGGSVLLAFVAVFIGISLAAVGGGLLVVAQAKKRMRDRQSDPHGLLPVKQINTAPWWRRLLGHREITIIDPNRMAVPAARLTITRGGQMFTDGGTFGAAEAAQREENLLVARQRAAAAGLRRGPSVAEIKLQRGWYDNLPDRSRPVVAVTPALPVPRLTLDEAFAQSVDGRVILGQDDRGGLAQWEPEHSHIGVFGATGTGKTSRTAMMAAAVLARWGWHVLILDPDHGKDWGVIQPWVEFAPTDGSAFVWQSQAIKAEWRRRMDLLAAHQARHIHALPEHVRPVDVAVIVEEFGALRAEAAASGNGATIDDLWIGLARQARSAGIHLVLLEQLPRKWPAEIKSNLRGQLTYWQDAHLGQLAGYHRAYQLQQGRFAWGGREYESWMVAPHVQRLLARAAPFSYPPILVQPKNVLTHTPTPAPIHGVTNTNVQEGSSVRDMFSGIVDEQGKLPMAAAQNRHDDAWDQLATRYFEKHPTATQGDLCRAMATVDPLQRGWQSFKGSLSMDLWHTYSPTGNPSRIQTDKRRAIRRRLDAGRSM